MPQNLTSIAVIGRKHNQNIRLDGVSNARGDPRAFRTEGQQGTDGAVPMTQPSTCTQVHPGYRKERTIKNAAVQQWAAGENSDDIYQQRREHPGAGTGSLTRSGRSRPPASIAGWCRRPRFAFISASAWPMASACSGCRCRARSGVSAPKACPDMTLVQELFTTTCDWKVASMGWMYTLFFVLLGIAAAVWGGWLERVGPRKAGFVSALCWCGGLFLGAIGIYTPSALAVVARLRRDRRHRPRSRLHLAGVDAGEMVPGPARHGDRHGHHGLRRRRHDRRAAGEPADELFQDPDLGRRLGNLRRDGRDLLRVHDDRRLPLSHSAGRLAARGLDPAGQKPMR